ncbi:MAG: protein phosphatase CheZ [Xanthobacteraceae bacterium]|nr:protein phosphatase CheZ [Xanthobacteraceae bacterium]
MAAQRKRFRIEELQYGALPQIDVAENDFNPMHDRIMTELRGIREQMGRISHGRKTETPDVLASEENAARATLESYRAQIIQCEKLKVELDLIHEAINRTKEEIAVLHDTSFSSAQMSRVTGELGAIVGGTEEATDQILAAAEAIDQAAAAILKVDSPEQQAALASDISERVVGIFEACNFQDLTGQRISKVMTTMRFIEARINVMMDIWGGVDAIKVHAPAIVDHRDEDAKLLNGPKLADDEGHVSQNDIDALFP